MPPNTEPLKVPPDMVTELPFASVVANPPATETFSSFPFIRKLFPPTVMPLPTVTAFPEADAPFSSRLSVLA